MVIDTGATSVVLTYETAKAAGLPLELLDYVAIGGVYATTSKDNTAAPIGIDGLRHAANAPWIVEPGLAGAARPDDGDQTPGSHEVGQRSQLRRPPDELAELAPQVGAVLSAGGRRGCSNVVQCGVLGQDRRLQRAQLGTRIQPELVAENSAGLLERAQRLRLAPSPVQGEHQEPVQALAQRVLGDQ